MTFHETILVELLKYKDKNPRFRFLTRQRDTKKGKFEKGYWFQGTANYAFVGLTNASGGTNMTRSIGLVFSPISYGFSCSLEIVHNQEKNRELIQAYQSIVKSIGGFKKSGETKFVNSLGRIYADDFAMIYDFLDENYFKIIDELKTRNLDKAIITEEKFIKVLSKVDKFRKDMRSKPKKPKSNTKPISLPLNTIFYGPPGTGKTYELQNKYFDFFTIRESSLTKDQYLENLVADLTWWQTFATALKDIGTSSISDMLTHDLVKAKERLSTAKKIKPIAWSGLQTHTVQNCPNVNLTNRIEPLIFYKEEDSKWRVEDEALEGLYPEANDILNLYRNFNPNPEKIIKNYEFMTFHQSFGYEDFVEGIKPVMEDETTELTYRISDGIFKRLSLKAAANPDQHYAIFIDEINRGNVSAIFGDLITLIEVDKRIGAENELMVKLPYSKTLFGVPPNLYIFGTMNTADRSVESLDSALRRRFVFKEVMPKPFLLSPSYSYWNLLWKHKNKDWGDRSYAILESSLFSFFGSDQALYNDRKKIWAEMSSQGKKEEQINWLERYDYRGVRLDYILSTINERIEVLLDRDHTIGHSYFLKVLDAQDKISELATVLQNKVIPLLQEYFYNDYEKIALVLGEGFVKQSEEGKINFAKLEQGESPDIKPQYEIVKNVDIESAIKLLLNFDEDDA